MAGRENWRVGIAAVGLIVLTAFPALGAIIGPYTADSDTLHLWHFNEADPGPAAPAPGISGSWNLTMAHGATLGNTSYAGFGTALNTTAQIASNAEGGTQSVSSVTGPTGAFTFEALLKPSTITGSLQEIMSIEGNGPFSDRPFQFAITTDGKLDFANVGGASGVLSYVAPIPTTGPDAFVANQWFHVAVTYNGAANTANNITLYWTRVDPSRTAADPLFSGQMVDDLSPTGSNFFEVGNDGRDTHDTPIGGHPFLGSIDEVRISDVARTADEFIFTTPEPTSLGLMAVGGMMLIRRRRCGR